MIRTLATVAFFSLPLACQTPEKTKPVKKEQPQAAASAKAPVKKAPKPQMPKGNAVPTGPRIVLVPGKGAGAVRFGATFETVERHMAGPCDIKTETRCGYVDQAIEYAMKEGVVSGIKVHRRGRQVEGAEKEGQKYYGSFRGIVQPKLMLGLHRHVVVEEFGEPSSKAPLKGADGQVETHTYDGIVFEYDKIENGNTVLSGIEIVPSKTAPVGPQKGEKGKASPATPK